MSDALSFAEITGQHVELLPARTTLMALSGFDYDSNDKGGDATAAAQVKDNVVFGDLIVTTEADASADDVDVDKK